MFVSLAFLVGACSINSFHSPEPMARSETSIGASWTAFPVNDSGTKIAGFPTVWLRFGLPEDAEAGMGISLLRYKPQGADQSISAITASPYIKKQLIRKGPVVLSGFAEAGAGTGKFFIAGSDSSWDTTNQVYYGSVGAVFGTANFYTPFKYTYSFLPELLSVGFVSGGLGASFNIWDHRLYFEALVHYAGDDMISLSGGGGFDF